MEAALDPSRIAIRARGTGFCIQIAVLTRCAMRSPRVLDRVREPREVPRAARSIAAGDLNKKCAESRRTVAVNILEPTRAILRRSLHCEVVEGLRDLIVAGELEPRSRVNEAALCERFGISRTPLREAINLLAAEGLLELLPNRGARVAALSAVEIEELLQVIGALEGAGAELAAERVTPEELAAIEAVHEGDARSLERTRLRPLFRAKP
jgi:hypothetical protein